jgi:hypothetical protein
MTTLVVLCFISKLFLGLDKLSVKELDKNLNSCPTLNHKTTFFPPHKLSKITFCPLNIVKIQNLFNT